MRRKGIIGIVFIVALVICVMYAVGGSTKQVDKVIGSSDVHTREEIENAMSVVEKEFKTYNWRGCELQTLVYDDKYNDANEKDIVLDSSFYVNMNGADGSFEPDSNEVGWKWILEKNDNGKWVLKDWGYN